MEKNENASRADLIRRYLYGFGHIYGVLPLETAASAFSHYEPDSAVPDVPELQAAFADTSWNGLPAPCYDAENQWFYDANVKFILNDIPEFCENVIDAHEALPIFYPSKEEVLSYSGGVMFSPTPAWNEFLEYCSSKKFLSRCSADVLLEHCSTYYLYLQTTAGELDDFTRPPEWFLENFMHIKNDGVSSRIQILAMRMYYYTRFWMHYGRNLGDCFEVTRSENPDDADLGEAIERFARALEEAEAYLREPVLSMKIPRNARCPCGSGKKYKNCCGRNL